jgi:hypothetical protein
MFNSLQNYFSSDGLNGQDPEDIRHMKNGE